VLDEGRVEGHPPLTAAIVGFARTPEQVEAANRAAFWSIFLSEVLIEERDWAPGSVPVTVPALTTAMLAVVASAI
jgi:hypothetical protein